MECSATHWAATTSAAVEADHLPTVPSQVWKLITTAPTATTRITAITMSTRRMGPVMSLPASCGPSLPRYARHPRCGSHWTYPPITHLYHPVTPRHRAWGHLGADRRGVHRGFHLAVLRSRPRRSRCAVADRLADAPGHRRVLPPGPLGCQPLLTASVPTAGGPP